MREGHQTLTVKAPVGYPTICSSESMHALPDPADPDQGVIQNVPFFIDGLNFGDLVLLGPPDEVGVRPIEAIVTPSGHVRFLAFTGPLASSELIDHLAFEVIDWFAEQGVLPDDDSIGISEAQASEVGPLRV